MEILKARKGYLTILKGRPATGKTSAAILDMMNRVYLKDKIMFIEYEFAQPLFVSKLIEFYDFDLKELTNVNIVDGFGYTLPMLEELIKVQMPSFVYIDYAGLISDNDKKEKSRDDFLYEVCNHLSVLAKDKGISIILISGQTRDYEHGRKTETAFFGLQGFEKILDHSEIDNIIPMFIETDLTPENRERTILLFSKNGSYEKYSTINLKEIFGGH